MFGIFLTYSFYLSVTLWSIVLLTNIIKKEIKNYKIELIMFITGILFLISTISFSVDGGGNRALVLLPFFIFFPALLIKRFLHNIEYRKIFYLIIIFGVLLQFIQSVTWISVKYFPDPRETSSVWIQKNIPKESTVGIENIPIYQMLPDYILKEFYFKQHDNNFKTKYEYTVMSAESIMLPSYVIVSNDFDNLRYIKSSPKKDLVNRLKKEKYKKIKEFTPNLKYYNLFADKLYFILANIMPVPVNISIYEK